MITVMIRKDNKLDRAKAIGRLKHNLREPGAISKIKGKHIDTSKIDNNEVWTSYAHFLADYYHIPNYEQSSEEIKQIIKDIENHVRIDYESTKDSKGRKKTLRKNTKIFEEFIVTFGTDRAKGDEGLNDDEVAEINSKGYRVNIEQILEQLYRQGYSNFIITEHNDEKTKHYQILCTNYSYVTKKFVNINPAAYSKYGTELQDIADKAFEGVAKRGKRKSKAKHLSSNAR